MYDDLADLQTQYYRLEHITRGANAPLNDCGLGNILRELAKRADQKELEQMKMENAHLNAQVTAMAQELIQKSEEIRKYHAEQAVVFSQVWEFISQPGEIVNTTQLYDQLMESGDLVTAKQTIPILVKYSWMKNNLFEEIQKVVPPSGTPRRVLY